MLGELAETYLAVGRTADARDAWQRALDLCETQHRATDAARIRARLASLDPAAVGLSTVPTHAGSR